MPYDFDHVTDRLPTESVKWRAYAPGILPLWVADMDFPCPEPVIQTLQERVAHGIFGYPAEPTELRTVLVDWIRRYYGWQLQPEALVFLPGVVVGFNLAIRALAGPGDGILAQTPVYFPILWAPGNAGCCLDTMELSRSPDGSYAVDMDAFESLSRPARACSSCAIPTIRSGVSSGATSSKPWHKPACVTTWSSAQTRSTAISS